MPTPDRFPGVREEEEIKIEPSNSDPAVVGGIRLVSGAFRLHDSEGVFNPREAAAGISEATHKALRQLIHFIDDGPAHGFLSGAVREVLPTGNPFPTSIVWWTDETKTKKIVEKLITRSGGDATNVTPTPIVWKLYDVDGTTVLATITDAVSYSGVFEISRTRVLT